MSSGKARRRPASRTAAASAASDATAQSREQPVELLTVPMLFVGLVVGFIAGYFWLWWGGLIVALVVLGALSAVFSGRSRDAALGAILGTVIGWVGVLGLALFRGVL